MNRLKLHKQSEETKMEQTFGSFCLKTLFNLQFVLQCWFWWSNSCCFNLLLSPLLFCQLFRCLPVFWGSFWPFLRHFLWHDWQSCSLAHFVVPVASAVQHSFHSIWPCLQMSQIFDFSKHINKKAKNKTTCSHPFKIIEQIHSSLWNGVRRAQILRIEICPNDDLPLDQVQSCNNFHPSRQIARVFFYPTDSLSVWAMKFTHKRK